MDCRPDFSSAVLQAKTYIQRNRWKRGHDLAMPDGYKGFLAEWVGQLAAYPLIAGFEGNLLSGDPGKFNAEKALNFWDEIVNSLIVRSTTDPDMFRTVLISIALIFENDAELHPYLREWLIKYLRGEIVAPRRPNGRTQSEGLHNLIAHAVADLVDAGMNPTRNDESPPLSACDAVATALAELSLSPITFAGVKKIWLRWDKSFWIQLS